LILAIVTTILHLRGGAHLVRRIRSVGYFPQQVSLLEYGRSQIWENDSVSRLVKRTMVDLQQWSEVRLLKTFSRELGAGSRDETASKRHPESVRIFLRNGNGSGAIGTGRRLRRRTAYSGMHVKPEKSAQANQRRVVFRRFHL
jgi:hypothetical protein